MKPFIKKTLKKVIPNHVLVRELGFEHNTILFTFDDGPHPSITPLVLELFNQHSIKACFFCIGKSAIRYPDLIKAIDDNGHLIGNHTFDHKNVDYISLQEIYNDISKCQEILFKITGKKPLFFRPPRGKITPYSIWAARKAGLKTVLWSIGGGEWGANKGKDSAAIANGVVNSVKSGDILLLHDDYAEVISVLNAIIAHLLKAGINMDGGTKILYKLRQSKLMI